MTPGTPITLTILEQTLQGLLLALGLATLVVVALAAFAILMVWTKLKRQNEQLWRIIEGQARRVSALEARVTHLFSKEDETLEYKGIKLIKGRIGYDDP